MMDPRLAVGLLVVLIVAGVARAILFPTVGAMSLKTLFRARPDARPPDRTAAWVRFSRRFGAPYAIALIVISFAWAAVGGHFLPDTAFGAWLVLGPSLVTVAAGIVLGAMAVVRWAMDD